MLARQSASARRRGNGNPGKIRRGAALRVPAVGRGGDERRVSQRQEKSDAETSSA